MKGNRMAINSNWFFVPAIWALVSAAGLSAVNADTGGPDAFGYSFIDSNEPNGPAVDFEDISKSGTNVNLSDDQVSGAIPIGFSFNLYGVGYTDIYISSNGFLTFLAGQDDGCCSGDPIPNSDNPNAVVAGFWADLYPPGGDGTIHYQTLGDEPNRRFIVQFTDIRHCCSDTGPIVTMQYKLFEGTTAIETHYLTAQSDGSTISVGIENESGTVGLQYSRGSASLTTPLAIRFSRDCNNNGIEDDQDIANGTSQDIDNNGLPDECEDCDQDTIPDGLEIAECDGSLECQDCNFNGIPDGCEDCNGNGLADPCEFGGLFSIDRFDPTLHIIDPNSGQTLETVNISLPGMDVDGGKGLTVHPVTGALWAILDIEEDEKELVLLGGGIDRQELVTINRFSGQATSVGTLTDEIDFSALAFNADGSTLYAVTGRNQDQSDSLFILDQGDGDETFVVALTDSEGGEALAFNPDDGLLYRAGGESDDVKLLGNGGGFRIFESINPDTLAITPIGVSGEGLFNRPRGMTYDSSQGRFLLAGEREFDISESEALFSLTTGGESTALGFMNHRSKGLVLIQGDANDCDANRVPDECDPDCDLDGTPDACVLADCDGSPECRNCNRNGIPDGCDIAAGTSNDCNSNGIPDECELGAGDLVMGDRNSDKVYIYYDIFNVETGDAPDVILDNAVSRIGHPRAVDVGNCLVVANKDSSTVTIYDDFLNLSDNEPPDVVLDFATSRIDDPTDLQLFNGDLYVASQDNNEVLIFRNVAAIIAGGVPVAPDVILDSAGSEIDNPNGLAVVDGILYVANEGADTVTIYNDVSTLANADPPNVTLDEDVSGLDDPKRVFVIDNVLYVVNASSDEVTGYSPADALTDSQAPDFRTDDTNDPKSVAIAGGRLWVGQNDNPGLIGFDDPANPEDPSVQIADEVDDSSEITSFEGTLWGASGSEERIWGYLDPASVVNDQPPDVILTHLTMDTPKAIVIAERQGLDCNKNAIPDECDPDCDANGIPDDCDLAQGALDDDGDGVLDVCDLCPGFDDAIDNNGNGIPDACEGATILPPPPPTGGGGGGAVLFGSGIIGGDGSFLGRPRDGQGRILAQIVLAGGAPGETVSFALTLDGVGDNDTGFASGVSLDKVFTVETTADPGSFTVTVSITFNLDVLAELGIDPADVQMHVFDEDLQQWVPAGDVNVGESGPTGIVGETGHFFGLNNVTYWAVLSDLSTFAVGVPLEEAIEPGEQPGEQPTPPEEVEQEEMPPGQPAPQLPAACGAGISPCGSLGMISFWGMLLGLSQMKLAAYGYRRNRRRRLRH